MNPKVKDLVILPDYQLELTFTNGECRVFDANPIWAIQCSSHYRMSDCFHLRASSAEQLSGLAKLI